jgi:thymidylate kinase
MKIISISGLDGSGKSTQIKQLQEYLESQGKKVAYFHAVQFSMPQATKTFFKKHCLICKLVGKCKIDSKPKEEKGVTKANWLQIQLRKIILPIDICRFKKLLKKLEKQGFDYLVSDRYFYDNLINVSYLSKKEPSTSNLEPRTYIAIPRPNFAFYLKTDPQTIMRRDRVPDQGLAYLEAKKKLLDKYTPIFGLTTIDGNRSKEEIFEEIKKGITD